MSNMMPLVSILVPSFNYAHLIEKCIDSIMAQTFNSWELIVCDDQSSDKSFEIIQHYTTDPRIKVYLNETNLGLYPNIVRCLSHSKGEYIKILMADDWLHPEYLEATVCSLIDNPQVALCSVRTEVINELGCVVDLRCEPKSGQSYYDRDDLLRFTTSVVNPIGNPSRVIFRRTAYDSTAGFDLDIEYCTENDLWLRMLEYWDVIFVTKVLSYELLHSTNATRKYVRQAQHLTTGEQMYMKLFAEHQFYKGQYWLQQAVFLNGWLEYWNAALRHYVEGERIELDTLLSIVRRNTLSVLWVPLLAWRMAKVITHKILAKSVGAS